MVDIEHETLDEASSHPPGWQQDADPGAVGTGKVWIDTSDGAGKWVPKVRNAADDGWEIIAPSTGSAWLQNVSARRTTATVAVTNITWTDVDWEAVEQEDWEAVEFVTNPERIILDEAGHYLVIAQVIWATDDGARYARILRNGDTAKEILIFGDAPTANINDFRHQISGIIEAEAGDYISLQVYQGSGDNTNLKGGAIDAEATRIFVTKLKAAVGGSNIRMGIARADQDIAQSLSTASVRINYDNVTEDDDNTITTGSSWVFTAPYDCLVIATACLCRQSGTELWMSWKIGSTEKRKTQQGSSGSWNTVRDAFCYSMAKDETLSAWVVCASATANSQAIWTWIDIVYIDLSSLGGVDLNAIHQDELLFEGGEDSAHTISVANTDEWHTTTHTVAGVEDNDEVEIIVNVSCYAEHATGFSDYFYLKLRISLDNGSTWTIFDNCGKVNSFVCFPLSITAFKSGTVTTALKVQLGFREASTASLTFKECNYNITTKIKN